MANEISGQVKLQIAYNGSTALGNKTMTRSIVGTAFSQDVQSVGTAAEVLAISDLSDLRYVYLYNPSSTATVTVTMAATLLKPGDGAFFTPTTTAVTLQATADATDVHKVITEA